MTVSLTSGAGARADARRNRALVLAAAQRAFAEQGASVSLAEIARRAGVGAGTVYRHFPTKGELLEAVEQQRLDRLAKLADAYRGAPDAGAAFFDFCLRVIATIPADTALCDMARVDDGWPRALLQSASERLHRSLGALLDAAQRQGAVRTDIDLEDVLAIFTAAAAIQRLRRPARGIDRAVELVLDALHTHPAERTVTKRGTDGRIRSELGKRDEKADGSDRCPVCRGPVRRKTVGRRARYCSPACRQKAHRRRAGGRVGTA